MGCHVAFQVAISGKVLGARRASERFFSSVGSDVIIEGALLNKAGRAIRTTKGFFPRVRTYVHGHVVFPGGAVRAEGTVVQLGARGEPGPDSCAFPNTVLPRLWECWTWVITYMLVI